MKPSIAIVGYGKVGTAFGTFLQECGYELIGYSKTDISNEPESGIKISQTPHEITIDADIVLITTPDGLIEEVTKEITANKGFKEGVIVLHCSGAQPSTLLESAKSCGAKTGSVHPLQSVASKTFAQNPFKGVIFAVEGEEDAVKAGEMIASDLEAKSFRIKTESKTLYHAAAVVASNYLVSLMDFSISLLETSGIKREDCFSVISPLISGTLKNIEKNGTQKALTGPIVRGDGETVANHINAISKDRDDLLGIYKTLGDYTVEIAKDSLDEDKIKMLKKILSNS